MSFTGLKMFDLLTHYYQTMADFKTILGRSKEALLSRRGKNVLVFLVFVAISAVLWIIMTLNEEVQKDLRCRVEIVNCPDSVKMISYLPEVINVNVKGRGSQLLKYSMGDMAVVKVDYKYFIKGNHMSLGDADLRGIFRNMFGPGSQILAINPDSISLMFTSRRPVRLPVSVDSRVTASPTAVLLDMPKSTTDSVWVYSVGPLDPSVRHISTQPIQFNGLSSTKSVKVRLIAPDGCRVEPDSVTVTIPVEKLIVTSANMPIETVGVPSGERLLLFPNHVNVSYMVPLADYEQNKRGFKIIADYRSIEGEHEDSRVRLKIITLPTGHAQNFSLETDSVSYMIER